MGADVEPPHFSVDDAVRRALAEDLTPLGDITSLLLPQDLRATASLLARGAGVVAGCACFAEGFRQVDEDVAISWAAHDGDAVEAGFVLASIEGRIASILISERTALNFLGHLSGIATLTQKFVVAAAAGGSARIWDTRKTTPGLRALEKAAVRAGGGSNHRGNLSDWILLKDNHLALLAMPDAVDAARRRWPGRTVHVECDRLDQVETAISVGADAILLDNMTPREVRECVAVVDAAAERSGAKRPLLEVSGGVNLDTVAGYAGTGVDLISVGAITNSAVVLDFGLDISQPSY